MEAPTAEKIDRFVDESACIIRENASEILGIQTHSDKPSNTPEIIDLCVQKRVHANKVDRQSKDEYKRLKCLVEKKIRQGRRHYVNDKFRECEEAFQKVKTTSCIRKSVNCQKRSHRPLLHC